MDFAEQENIECARFSWNCWPCNRIEAARVVVPLSIVLSPLKELPTLPVLPYEPVKCRKCSGVLNPYCQTDFYSKIWSCPFCSCRNQFPAHYAQISETLLPAELFAQHPAVEYVLSTPVPGPPVFLFLLDVALLEEEAEALTAALRQALTLLPENAFVGVITFGSLVYVHDLSAPNMLRSFVLRGDRELSGKEVRQMLGLKGSLTRRGSLAAASSAYGSQDSVFIAPLAECEFVIETILDNLTPEPCPRKKMERLPRATGAAVGVAVGLLESCAAGLGARVMVLTAGPATVGPGIVVGTDLAEPIRTHKDFDKGEAKHYKASCRFYETIAQRLADNGHCLDVFACSLDQVGLAEMQFAVQRTGGVMVMAEQFSHNIFKDSLARLFDRDADGNLRMAFRGTLEVQCSQDIKVEGAIGPVSAVKDRKTASVSEAETGVGGTSAWSLCSLDCRTAIAFFFEVTGQNTATQSPDAAFYIQYTLHYCHSAGQQRVRVMTLARRWAVPGAAEIGLGFDQETAAVVVARLAAYKCGSDEALDVLRWIDRSLIRLGSKFGEYRKDDPATFTLPENFSLFPQFMFHIRRSQFLQVFNNTPDETAFYRLMLSRADVGNGVMMIQPVLMSYGLDGPPTPCLLDVSSIQPDRILLLDDFFHVVILYGSTVAQWRDAGYQLQPEYANFRDLLAAPMADAEELCCHRLPVPRIISSDQGKSQARFLLAKVNPSATHASSTAGAGEIIFTDDVSLQVFLAHLAKLSVQGS